MTATRSSVMSSVITDLQPLQCSRRCHRMQRMLRRRRCSSMLGCPAGICRCHHVHASFDQCFDHACSVVCVTSSQPHTKRRQTHNRNLQRASALFHHCCSLFLAHRCTVGVMLEAATAAAAAAPAAPPPAAEDADAADEPAMHDAQCDA